MKSISGGSSDPKWEHSLYNDLSFIKQHLRYRISKKTVPATAILAMILFFASRTIWMAFLASKMQDVVMSLFVVLMMCIVLATGIRRYWRTLWFRKIETPYYAADNIKLIDDFLRSQQLNIYRHPRAPEVFQIVSMPIGKDETKREVMIFIADDKCILVNSHFTNQKWTIPAQSNNAARMAKQLEAWVVGLRQTSSGLSAR